MTRRTARKHDYLWLRVLFEMLDFGGGDSVLVTVLAGVTYLVLGVALVSVLVLASHLMNP